MEINAEDDFNLLVSMLNLEQSIENLRKILEAELRREQGKEMFVLQRDN